jgi:catechol-2,3-dioxygenase
MMSAEKDQPMIVGQGALCVSDVSRASTFYGALGLRPVLLHPHIAVFELRGGTHLLLFHARGDHPRGPVRSFALLVHDAAAYHDRIAERGVAVGPVWEDAGSRHRGFEVTDPDGHVLTVSSSAC